MIRSSTLEFRSQDQQFSSYHLSALIRYPPLHLNLKTCLVGINTFYTVFIKPLPKHCFQNWLKILCQILGLLIVNIKFAIFGSSKFQVSSFYVGVKFLRLERAIQEGIIRNVWNFLGEGMVRIRWEARHSIHRCHSTNSSMKLSMFSVWSSLEQTESNIHFNNKSSPEFNNCSPR